jgi:hypothetical protein
MLRNQLASVAAEVSFDEALPAQNAKDAKNKIADQAKAIADQVRNDPDAFVKDLIAKRADLAGLPWRQGKDCRLTPAQGQVLASWSLSIRQALDASLVPQTKTSAKGKSMDKLHPNDIHKDVDQFWWALDKKAKYNYTPSSYAGNKFNNKEAPFMQPSVLPTLQQFLMAENLPLRLSFVEYLSAIPAASASAALAQRAVFDLEPEVRVSAIQALRNRPAEEYLPVLLEAMRYPWVAAAQHAAEALVALQRHDALPQLVPWLDQPDPGAPFERVVQGTTIAMVREVVQVNHLRNCLLCHAPSTSAKDPVRGPIPTPGEPLPPSAVQYYAKMSGAAVVRADVTYLKQDFSVMQAVAKPDAWPTYQRYDFLVRIRPLSPAELEVYKKQKLNLNTPALSEHKQAILYVLRALTGRDAGTSGREWQAVLNEGRRQPL